MLTGEADDDDMEEEGEMDGEMEGEEVVVSIAASAARTQPLGALERLQLTLLLGNPHTSHLKTHTSTTSHTS